jgi:hypothetical protein
MTSHTDDANTSINRLVAEFFRCVSFVAGERPDYAGIREVFIAAGLLIKGTPTGSEVMSLDDFIAPREKSFAGGELSEFRETELAGSTTVFGSTAHRESRYEKAGVQSGVPFGAQGVIFTQVVLTASGWRMSSMAWDDERAGLALDDRAVFQASDLSLLAD